jgi:hypothetical protein
MGFGVDRDFVAVQDGVEVRIDWLSQQPMPTEAEIDAYDMTPAAVAAREDAKEPFLVDIKAQAQGAIDENTAFLAIASPTNAQTLAQVKRLTQQNTRIIKALARVVVRTWR